MRIALVPWALLCSDRMNLFTVCSEANLLLPPSLSFLTCEMWERIPTFLISLAYHYIFLTCWDGQVREGLCKDPADWNIFGECNGL